MNVGLCFVILTGSKVKTVKTTIDKRKHLLNRQGRWWAPLPPNFRVISKVDAGPPPLIKCSKIIANIGRKTYQIFSMKCFKMILLQGV